MAEIAAFTPEQARLLWQDYQSRKQQPQPTRPSKPIENTQRSRAAVIGSALTSPSSSLAVMTSCTIYFLDVQSDNTRVLNEEPYTAYNDDPQLSASAGKYCRVEWLDGRWMIYYLNCTAQAALTAVLP